MAVARYNMPIRSKVKVGRMKSFPCVVGYFASDLEAEAARVYIQSLMANYASVGLTKTLVQNNEGELADPPSVNDTFDIQLILGSSVNGDVRQLTTIPGANSDINATVFLALGWHSSAGTACDVISKKRIDTYNVIAGDKI